ncbi:MAG: peroxiredoxin family protein, partial [Planctomycetales bacterium]
HHYKIHLWDYEKPSRAGPSAARAGQAAPKIAHMWHMPGHTFSRLKRYGDAVWQQEASSRADHAHMIRDRVMPYEIHNYAHNQEWCVRNMLYIGRVRDAIALSKNLIEAPQHPKRNTLSKRGSCAAYGRSRLLQTLNTYELWDEAKTLCDSVYLEPSDSRGEQVKRLRLLGAACLETGDLDRGKEQIAALEEQLKAVEKDIEKAAENAKKKATKEKKKEAQVKKAVEAAKKSKSGSLKSVKDGLNDLRVRLAIAEGRKEDALKLMPKLTGLHKANLARLWFAAGDKDKAESVAKEAAGAVNEIYPLAVQAEIFHRAGKAKEAKKTFEKLRKQSAHLDLDVPVFQRLAELAKSNNCPDDWRVEYKLRKDIGDRPDLASIGPLRWTPSKAPAWALPNDQGKTLASREYEGRPVLVIFYLGYGCLHCVEQLAAFAPKAEEYQKAGIEIVAVSTDPVNVLQKAVEASGRKEPFPFPLLSDESLKAFKDFRAHDDFENVPLHGTYLIDAEGFIRWQDVSYEPFTEPDFLLKECKRLLAQ